MGTPSMIDSVIENLRAARQDIEALLAQPMSIQSDGPEMDADLAIERAEEMIRAIPQSNVYKGHALVLLASALDNLIGDMPAGDAQETCAKLISRLRTELEFEDKWHPAPIKSMGQS
jgi:hypothetical protein